jgi:hypothetical protein
MRVILDKRPMYEQMALYRSGLYIVFCVLSVNPPVVPPMSSISPFFFGLTATIASIGSSYGPMITPSSPQSVQPSRTPSLLVCFSSFRFICSYIFFKATGHGL